MEYDDDEVLTRYIWDHYSHLMGKAEILGLEVASARESSVHADSDLMRKVLLQRWGSTLSDEVILALDKGAVAFRTAVKNRLMRECWKKISINRCLKCQRIVNSPKAQVCLWCGYDWHRHPAG